MSIMWSQCSLFQCFIKTLSKQIFSLEISSHNNKMIMNIKNLWYKLTETVLDTDVQTEHNHGYMNIFWQLQSPPPSPFWTFWIRPYCLASPAYTELSNHQEKQLKCGQMKLQLLCRTVWSAQTGTCSEMPPPSRTILILRNIHHQWHHPSANVLMMWWSQRQ